MPATSLSEIGTRGLVVYSDSKFYFAFEDDWRDNGLNVDCPSATALVKHGVLCAQLLPPWSSSSKKRPVLVNLDAMNELRVGEKDPGTITGINEQYDQSDILIHEAGRLYGIEVRKLRPLDADLSGDAGVLINRGTIVAAIPENDIPSGTWCVLLNLSSIGSE